VAFCLVAACGVYVHTSLWEASGDAQGEDVYYAFVEGTRLIEGVNPYARVLESDMRTNDKYATYFPLFYVLSAVTQALGWTTWSDWLTLWRGIFLAFNIGIGYLIFRICAAGSQPLLGILGAAFWLFNRWTLHVTWINHIDFMPLLFLLLSLSLLRRRFALACGLFGLSLAIKHVAIFALPLYLMQAWRRSPDRRLQELSKALALIAAIPLAVSIPFLIWNGEGFVKSLLFSATRDPDDHFGAPSLDALFGISGVPAKTLMVVLWGLTYVLVWSQRVPLYSSVLLLTAVFFGFNSVLFRQYIVWLMPFMPLALNEVLARTEAKPSMTG
jgi:uncharacterized membrane protein